jgi:hypothetical protein
MRRGLRFGKGLHRLLYSPSICELDLTDRSKNKFCARLRSRTLSIRPRLEHSPHG